MNASGASSAGGQLAGGVSDPVQAILAYNAGREPERLARKYSAMCDSPFVFLRGTCHLFYARLPDTQSPDAPLLRDAPTAWVCGDLHLENFGSYRGDNRLVYFDITDFDEAALAPLTWDLARLLTSVLCAAGELGLARTPARAMCRAVIDSYAQALAEGSPRWIERDVATGPVKTLLDGLRERRRIDFLDSRTERRSGGDKPKGRRLRIDGKRALAASDADHARVSKLIERFAKGQPDPAFFDVIDVARRIAGTGSQGLERYVVLVAGKGTAGKRGMGKSEAGKRDAARRGDANHLLDLKFSLPSSLDTPLRERLQLAQPHWPHAAERVVALEQRLQAVPAAMLHPIISRERSYVLRSLLPSQDRVRLDPKHTRADELAQALRDMGRLAAWAHLRASGRQGAANADALIAFGRQRKAWGTALLGVAEACAAQVKSDWQAWVAAVAERGKEALAHGH